METFFARVKALMADGEWRDLGTIARETGGSEVGTSARLRDLRKERFGGYEVEKKRLAGGVFVYRVRPRNGSL